MAKNFDKEALKYHTQGRPGKIEVVPTKKCDTEHTLSLAYSPGVAAPCMEIAENPDAVFKYTAKGNLVAVISDGTAVLGLGDIGPLGAKPVMEGKGILFKQFADIDVFDIELDVNSPEEFIQTVKALEPTFGGINLEDIAAPNCFIVEKALIEQLKIPVFHDDQHGTAIICAAAMINASHLVGKKLKEMNFVFNGAGAASISCARLLVTMGAQLKNIIMCDSRGVIFKGRTEGMNPYKAEFQIDTPKRTLSEALEGADAFLGLSVAGAVTKAMVENMCEQPIIFAMANPVPEILPEDALAVRPNAIVATGRTDFPNQVNNVLGFPSIFRGALDVQATQINLEMKLAAVEALAALAREDVPESVSAAYKDQAFAFGPSYIIPKPFDPRVLSSVAPKVAEAAMKSGVALRPIKNMKAYKEKLETIGSHSRGFVRSSVNRIKTIVRKNKIELPTLLFPEGHSEKILRALKRLGPEKICRPVLLGYEELIRAKIQDLELDELLDIPIYHPTRSKNFKKYVDLYYKSEFRKGLMREEAERLMSNPYYYSAMAANCGDADGVISGALDNYPNCVRPILKIIGTGLGNVAAGMSIVLLNGKVFFFCDTTINIDPTAEQLASIAGYTANVAKFFNITPKIALLSYTNFTGKKTNPRKMKRATELIKERFPDLMVDGEMQADIAINGELTERLFPFSLLKNGANILVFPNLDASNIAYKLLQQMAGAEILGPFILGTPKAANVLQRSCRIEEICNTVTLTALESLALKDL